MHKEFKMQESRIYMDIDEMKIQHDIRKAMTELEKLNLDKIFTTTLQQVITISAVDTSRHTYSLIKIQPWSHECPYSPYLIVKSAGHMNNRY